MKSIFAWLKSLFTAPARASTVPPVQSNTVTPVAKSNFVEPEFVVVKGSRFKTSAYKTASGKMEGLVVHYTVSGRSASSAIGVLRYLAEKGLGCMVMDEDGKIYIPEGFDVFKSAAAHAGASAWGSYRDPSGLNRYFGGMEICNQGRGSRIGPFRTSTGEANIIAGTYQTYTERQEWALKNFCLWAAHKEPAFKLENVCGHDEGRDQVGKRGDKTDPGASLSMTMPKFREHLKSLN